MSKVKDIRLDQKGDWNSIQEGFIFPLYQQEAEGLFFREHELEELWTQGSGTTEERSIIQKMKIK